MDKMIKAASVPLIIFGFLPLWLFLKEMPLGPDIGPFIDFIYASALTLSIMYFGWQLRTQ
ncbi:MAG: hypothetical protein OIN85_02675 [Candidatus Methanoperedens sp.]|nr:hypothetical protein [Candidatus Methanoperedens sp.]